MVKGRKEAIARLERRSHKVSEAGLTKYVMTELSITSRRRSGWLSAAASGDAP